MSETTDGIENRDEVPPPARRYLIEGGVQGVGFRWHTRQMAQELRLGGWVKNLPDGRVEARAAGAPDALATFEKFLHQGPPGARVNRVEGEDLDPEAAAELPQHFQVAF